MSSSLQPHGLQHTRLPCPSPSRGACPSSYPLHEWCHPTISSSVTLFSVYLPSLPASGSFPTDSARFENKMNWDQNYWPKAMGKQGPQRSVSKGSRHENLWEKENKRGWVEKEHLAEMGKTVEQRSLQLSTPSTHHRTQSLGLRLDNQYPYFTKKPTANFLFIEFWSPN